MSDRKMASKRLSKVRLELAREPDHPAGDQTYGYVMVAPLHEDGKIDAARWREDRERCRIVRFRPNGEEEIGHLVHQPGGQWAFHYDVEGTDKDEPGFRLGNEIFARGQYISIKSKDGMHTYRVTSVEPV